jgi:uncharacterized protein YxeA
MLIKKKLIIFSIIVLIIFIVIGVLLYRNISLNNFSDSYLSTKDDGKKSFLSNSNAKSTNNSEGLNFTEFNGKWSLMNFNSTKGNKITIYNNTKINKGKFCVVVLDSNYNIITKTNSNEEASLTFITPREGNYIIRIVGKKASGNFNIRVNSNKNISIYHKNFWS